MPIIGNPEHYLVNLLNNRLFNLDFEKDTQAQIEKVLKNDGISYSREHRLSNRDQPDFMIGDIAIEVKIKGSPSDILRQCKRYCAYPEVKSIILMTNKALGFPKQLIGKDCYVIDMGKAWL